MNRARSAALALCVTTIGWFGAPSPAVAADTSTSCAGIVYDDLDIDGIHDATETGLADISVRITPTNGEPVDLATDDDGTWAVDLELDAFPIRLEFTVPDPYRPSLLGADNGSSVQFISTADECGTSGLGKFGVYEPGAACASPLLVTGCYLSADAEGYDDAPIIQLVDPLTVDNRSVEGTTQNDWLSPTPTHLATQRDVGATYGLGTDNRGTIYASSFVKRHTRLTSRLNPTGNPTVIYRLLPGRAPEVLTVVDPSAVDPHGRIDAADYRTDSASFDDVYRSGLGDLDVSPDGSTLFTIDMGRRELITISLPSGRIDERLPLTGAALGIADCAVSDTNPFGDLRAFGLGFDTADQLLVGVVCSAESTVQPGEVIDEGETQQPLGDPSQLAGYVYQLDGEGLVPRLSWPLAIDRGETQQNGLISNDATWHPWVDGVPFADRHDVASYPQPAITDIAVDEQGNLIVALGDRWGHQTMPDSSAPTTDGKMRHLVEVVSAGDLQRACPDGANWVIEGSGDCAGGWGDGFEFFSGDRYGWHAETAVGSVLTLPNTSESVGQRLVATQMNPVHDEDPWRSGGLAWHDTTTGEFLRGVRLYDGRHAEPDHTFEKANGMADLALLCDIAPLQVGGRVWYDEDADGEQDPGELPIPDTVLELRDENGDLVRTTRSDERGVYQFSDDNIDGGLIEGVEYIITVAEWNFAHGPFSQFGKFIGLRSTLHDPGVNGELDSDGRIGARHTKVAGLTMAPVVAGDDPTTARIEGAIDHSVDFGMRDQYDLAVATRSVRNDDALGVLVFETVVHNQGSEASGPFEVTTKLPGGITLIAASKGATVVPGSRRLDWSFDVENQLLPGQFRVLKAVVSIDDPAQSPFVNFVEISADSGDDDDSTPGDADPNIVLDRIDAFREDGGLTDDNGSASLEDDSDTASVYLHQIVGRVWFDLDRDGRYEPDAPSDDPSAELESAGGGVTVRLLYSDGVEIERTTTRFDGAYAFAMVPSGEYVIDVPSDEFGPDRPLNGYDWLSTDPAFSRGKVVDPDEGLSVFVGIRPPGGADVTATTAVDLGIARRPHHSAFSFITPRTILLGLAGLCLVVLLLQRRSNRAALFAS